MQHHCEYESHQVISLQPRLKANGPISRPAPGSSEKFSVRFDGSSGRRDELSSAGKTICQSHQHSIKSKDAIAGKKW